MKRVHGGDLTAIVARSGHRREQILDFSANINPLGFPECVRRVVERSLEGIAHYPDPRCTGLVRAIAAHHGIEPNRIAVGNGASELLYHVARLQGLHRAVVPIPCYVDYLTAAEAAGLQVLTVAPLSDGSLGVDSVATTRAAGAISAPDSCATLALIGQPANPSGILTDRDSLLSLVRSNLGVLFCIDEAFADFAEGYRSLVEEDEPNMIVLRSMTKFYAVPGLRLGYCVAPAGLIEQLQAILPTWSVGTLAQAVGEAVLADAEFVEHTLAIVAEERAFLSSRLGARDCVAVSPSTANYLLLRFDPPAPSGTDVAEALLAEGIAVRTCENVPGLSDRYIRVAVRTRPENEILVHALERALEQPAVRPPERPPERAAGRNVGGRPAVPNDKTASYVAGRTRTQRTRSGARRVPALMFQGTSSNSGKSLLAAAFCRILHQDGYRVAPFKAQNMSLNSYVTAAGGEMGRAQVVQAQACRKVPDVRMNPVLLKPSSDTGSQIIVRGKPIGSMRAVSYFEYKRRLFETVASCYDELAAEHDVMVIEGAGSPAEVNLKKHDIVNMRMAAYAEAPVLIVGDIDRGGVFASFVGTMEVLNETERSLVRGFLVNKFRGDVSLLGSALDYTLDHTGKPVVGVVPWVNDHGLPEEDSVSFKEAVPQTAGGRSDTVTIAVIDLPHISNFTDFDSLRIEPDVELVVVHNASQLPERADAVILPGSKNVPADIRALRAAGILEAVERFARTGKTEIVGICGGLQMLGRAISDPHGIESDTGERGLGLLEIDTEMAPEKTLTAASALHLDSDLEIVGYEIHHGVSTGSGSGTRPAMTRSDGKVIGFAHEERPVWGTYLHGVFDADEFRMWFIDRLRTRRGYPPIGAVQARYDLERSFDRLAEIVRGSVELDRIYGMMGV